MTVDRETAEQDFERYKDQNDIEVDQSVDENERNDTLDAKETVIRAIMKGRLSIDEKCRPVLARPDGREIVFEDPGAAALVKTDQKKPHAKMAQVCIMLSEFTGVSENVFANMKPYSDFKICTAILVLFLV